MKSRYLFLHFVAGWAIFSPIQILAQPVTFDLIATFDYPEDGTTLTFALGIDDQGNVVGGFAGDKNHGFVRFVDGRFSRPLIRPDWEGGGFLSGLNAMHTFCGWYFDDSGAHGFIDSGADFTPFDISGAKNTQVWGLNDAGNFCGGYSNTGLEDTGFVSIDGVVTTFRIPESTVTSAQGINNLNECVGRYIDTSGIHHGFLRDADGNMIYPIDARGAESTDLYGINDRGWMVGRAVDRVLENDHGIFFQTPQQSAMYDYPATGVDNTDFTGVNEKGFICGYYREAATGYQHSFVVRVTPADGL